MVNGGPMISAISSAMDSTFKYLLLVTSLVQVVVGIVPPQSLAATTTTNATAKTGILAIDDANTITQRAQIRHCEQSLESIAIEQVQAELPALAQWLSHLTARGLPPRMRHLLLAYAPELGVDGLVVHGISEEVINAMGYENHYGVRLAKRRKEIYNNRTYYMFSDEDSTTMNCHIYIRNDVEPEHQMITLIHELAHCRFEQFWTKNHRSLARRLPATLAFHEGEEGTAIEARYFDERSEEYAVGMEISVSMEALGR